MMRVENICLIICMVILCIVSSKSAKVDDRGFGSQYDWFKLEDGLEQARIEKKPLMVIIHKSWCGACKALKPQFAESAEIENLSKNFILVHAEDDDEPDDKKFAPDGKYVPRIYFLDSTGEVHEDIYNENGNPSYKFYYFNAAGVITSMKEAIKKLAIKAPIQEEL